MHQLKLLIEFGRSQLAFCLLVFHLILFCVLLVASLFLVLGVLKNRRPFMLPWIVLELFNFAFNVACVIGMGVISGILLAHSHMMPLLIAIFAVWIVALTIEAYFICVVVSHFKQLKVTVIILLAG